MILLVLVVCLLLALAYRMKQSSPSGPIGLPIIGYLPWLDPKAPHKTLTSLSKRYGSIYGLQLGSVYTIVLSDIKLIKRVLAMESVTGRAPLYLTHGIMKGYGIICSEGNLWKDQRKFLYNCFRQFGIQKYGSRREFIENIILHEVSDFIKFVKLKNNEPIMIEGILRHNIGSVMNQLVFGKCYDRNDKVWLWLQHLQEEGVKHIGVAGPLNFLPFLRHLPMYRKVMNFLLCGKYKTHKLYASIIEKRICDGFDTITTYNVLDAFLNERNKLENNNNDKLEKYYNNDQFYHLLADVFGAGLDTTLTTLCWYFLFISHHQHIQESIYEELSSIVGDRSVVNLEDVENLHLLKASISEVQRIRSVVPLGIPHGTLESITINNYHIPKGTMIIPLQWALHMDENLWDEPEKFNPNRFLTEEGKYFKPEAFIPFQTGKRMCIGDELANMILCLFIANILKEFAIKSDEEELDLEGEIGITLTPKSQLLTLIKRP